jgi:hypothetical protein
MRLAPTSAWKLTTKAKAVASTHALEETQSAAT